MIVIKYFGLYFLPTEHFCVSFKGRWMKDKDFLESYYNCSGVR